MLLGAGAPNLAVLAVVAVLEGRDRRTAGLGRGPLNDLNAFLTEHHKAFPVSSMPPGPLAWSRRCVGAPAYGSFMRAVSAAYLES